MYQQISLSKGKFLFYFNSLPLLNSIKCPKFGVSMIESGDKKGVDSGIVTLNTLNILDPSIMRCSLLIFIASLCFFQAFSQENDSIIVLQSPAGRLSGLIDIQDLVNEGSNDWGNEFDGHWAGVEIGVNGFANADYSLYDAQENDFLSNDLIRSNVLNLNMFQYSKGLQSNRNTIGIVTGLGMSLQSYRLDRNTSIELDDLGKVQPVNLFFDSNQKSKLSIVYLEVPLLVEFQVPVKDKVNRLYCSAGINVGRRLTSHTKVKYHMDGKKEKLKAPGDYAIRGFKFAAIVRVGYQRVSLFAAYDLMPLFEDQRGPVLYPISIGIKLISF